jgi:RNA polymerase sigma-70 factor (ECF subfamily)
LEKGLFAEADPARGRFRSFLRTVCAHFLANRHDREQAQKRCGGRRAISIDAADAEERYAAERADHSTPERLFDRSWALTLLARTLDRLGREYHDAGKTATFEALRGMLAGAADAPGYGPTAERLGISDGAARVAVHRLRRRYGDLLREEIAATVAEPAEIEDEIRSLFAALGS